MKKTLIISSMAIVCLALAVGLVLAPKVHAASGGSSKTAQSVMVQTNLSNSAFEIVGDTTYHWDPQDSDACAEGYYHAADGVWDGNTPDCSGSAANCAESNQPPVPPVAEMNDRAWTAVENKNVTGEIGCLYATTGRCRHEPVLEEL